MLHKENPLFMQISQAFSRTTGLNGVVFTHFDAISMLNPKDMKCKVSETFDNFMRVELKVSTPLDICWKRVQILVDSLVC